MRLFEKALAVVLVALLLTPSASLAADMGGGLTADFVSVCFEEGHGRIAVAMSVAYGQGTVGKVASEQYLYVRADAGSEGFRWLPPQVNGDTLSWSFSLEEGQRAAFWLLDDGENPPRLDIEAAGSEGGSVSARTVGLFRSPLAKGGEGRFSLPDAGVSEDAEDKAGIPNAKVLLRLEPGMPADRGEGNATYGVADGEGEAPRDWQEILKTGDAVVLACLSAIAVSLVAFLFMRRRRD